MKEVITISALMAALIVSSCGSGENKNAETAQQTVTTTTFTPGLYLTLQKNLFMKVSLKLPLVADHTFLSYVIKIGISGISTLHRQILMRIILRCGKALFRTFKG
ncbi:hypothetical protein [Chryseobacterium caseinilyticum]|uniref:Uncharacterized protein n=1 Tax=Chryseobacterium caseinilyticum TaxID=2771428 RepID=A0ABR8Z7T6_9FLAO|nr:hypothetical protein [Chryseobacterium caseinilyticum]MBD8080816.1 hypothetical protein [Chryseobacterium caseinilyticum]